MKRSRLITTTLFFVLVITASAHQLWLVPSTFIIKTGQPVRVAANTGEDFPDSTSAVTPDRVARCSLTSASGTSAISELRVRGNSLILTAKPSEPGNAIIELVVRPKLLRLAAAKFTAYLADEGLIVIIAARRAAGTSDQEGRERYAKYCKTLLQVGGQNDDTWQHVFGHRLEIIPAQNPYLLKTGDQLSLLVLYEGQPLARAQIESGTAATKGKPARTQTDTAGHATITLSASGPTFIHTVTMVAIKNDPQADWESSWATLTFAVTK